jgi:acetoin utilization deacetylase AcuC-like enzyme
MVAGLREAGLWDGFPKVDAIDLPRPVLEAVHSWRYLSLLESASRHSLYLDGDTYTTPTSWELALQAAGGASALASRVWRGEARRGFALCRPPGHHATPTRGMGFCLLNNIALAAQYLRHAEGAERLAIVDLDLHHGNGTQDIFWERKDVLFISTHQSPLYPGSGQVSERGEGPGLGYTANIPLPPLSGDQAFQATMHEVILPLLDRYAPQMLLVSVGFDTHWRDPLGQLILSAQVFYELIASLREWADQHANGRIALVLEGGYDLDAATACCNGAVAALLGQPFQDPLGPAPQRESELWRNVIDEASRKLGISD